MTAAQRSVDVRAVIDGERFPPFQWTILVLCFLVVALVGAALMGLGWQFGAVFSLLAAPAVIAAGSVYLMVRRRPFDEARRSDETGAAVAVK